jgi:predicted O-linked N-acetylglucosamine transferase (SPINDLY family)
VDVLLDSHPFGGHTVGCHALWMGVPVVTLAGSRHSARMVASVLRTIGLPDLIAQSPEEYVQIALQLAADPSRLASLRRTMRERMAASPLLDAPRFARDLELAYRRMWNTATA